MNDFYGSRTTEAGFGGSLCWAQGRRRVPWGCGGCLLPASCGDIHARGEWPTPIIREETTAAWPLCVVSAHPPPGRVIWFPRGADGLLAGVGPAPQSCPALQLRPCPQSWLPNPSPQWSPGSQPDACYAPTHTAPGAKTRAVSFCSQFSINLGQKWNKGGRQTERRRAGRRKESEEAEGRNHPAEELGTLALGTGQGCGVRPQGWSCRRGAAAPAGRLPPHLTALSTPHTSGLFSNIQGKQVSL